MTTGWPPAILQAHPRPFTYSIVGILAAPAGLLVVHCDHLAVVENVHGPQFEGLETVVKRRA